MCFTTIRRRFYQTILSDDDFAGFRRDFDSFFFFLKWQEISGEKSPSGGGSKGDTAAFDMLQGAILTPIHPS